MWSAPSHDLNQCSNIVNLNLGNKLQWNLKRKLYIFILEHAFENDRQMGAVLSRPLFWYVGLHVQCIHYVWQMTSWMKTFPALLALCAENSPFTGEFPTQRPVKRSFNVFFDLRRKKRLSKQSWSWWFETSLWRNCNEVFMLFSHHFGIFVAGWERNVDNPDFIDVGQLDDICYRLTGCRIFYKNSKFVARIY